MDGPLVKSGTEATAIFLTFSKSLLHYSELVMSNEASRMETVDFASSSITPFTCTFQFGSGDIINHHTLYGTCTLRI